MRLQLLFKHQNLEYSKLGDWRKCKAERREAEGVPVCKALIKGVTDRAPPTRTEPRPRSDSPVLSALMRDQLVSNR